MRFGLLTVSSVLLASAAVGVAQAKPKVAIGEVSGPTGAQISYAVQQALQGKVDLISNRDYEQAGGSGAAGANPETAAEVGAALSADAVVVGAVSRVSNKWECTLLVVEVASRKVSKEWAFGSSSLRSLSKIAGRQAALKLGPALRAAESASAGPPKAAAPTAAATAPRRTAPTGTRRVSVFPFVGGGTADRVQKIVVQKVGAMPEIELIPSGDVIAEARQIGVLLKEPVGRLAVAEMNGLNAYVMGRVFKKGSYYYAIINVHQGRDGETIETLKLKRSGIVALGGAIAARLKAPMQAALAPDVPDAPEGISLDPDQMAGAFAEETQPDASAETKPKKERKARGADARSRTPLVAALGFKTFFRSFDYNDPLTALRPYEANFVPAITLDAQWYPMAHFQEDGVLRNLGVDVSFDYSFAPTSEDSESDAEFPTGAIAFLGGVRGRLPLGPHELGAVVTFGIDQFTLDTSNEGDVEPDIPNVEYTMARIGADGRFRVASFLDVGFAGGYRAVLDSGEIGTEPWFPRSSSGGFDATLKVAVPVLDPLHFEAGGTYLRYFFSFNVEPDDVGQLPIAGGALDEYTELFLRAIFVL